MKENQPTQDKQEQRGQMRTYYPEFDMQGYQVLHEWQAEDEKELHREIARQDSLTQKNLETMLGERCNVMLSEYRYDIRDGRVYAQDSDEPFIDIIKRGREFRLKNGKQIDRAREEAEVIGFEKIEETLTDPQTPEGTMMISISPPGDKESSYQKNFYDVFIGRGEGDEKYIETRRYSSALVPEEYIEKINVIDKKYAAQRNATAEDFLANPLTVAPNGITPDDLHEYLHTDHDFFNTADFHKYIVSPTQIFMDRYIDQLKKDPHDTNAINLALNAVISRAEEAHRYYQNQIEIREVAEVTDDELNDYGHRYIEPKETGCGVSDGYEVDAQGYPIPGPYSVAEFVRPPSSEKRTLKCTCPKCGKKVEADIGGGKITCPKCNASAPYRC